jgi:hypothetical protein
MVPALFIAAAINSSAAFFPPNDPDFGHCLDASQGIRLEWQPPDNGALTCLLVKRLDERGQWRRVCGPARPSRRASLGRTQLPDSPCLSPGLRRGAAGLRRAGDASGSAGPTGFGSPPVTPTLAAASASISAAARCQCSASRPCGFPSRSQMRCALADALFAILPLHLRPPSFGLLSSRPCSVLTAPAVRRRAALSAPAVASL